MYKLFKNIAPALLALVFAAACENKLEIQPTQSIDETNALSTSQDVQVTLTGAYAGLGDGDVLGGGIQYTAELVGDNGEAIFNGTFSTLDEIWNKAITTRNAVVRDIWLDSYNTINRANNVLSALDVVKDGTREVVEGEARFIRGITYFSLINLFAKTWGDGDNNANPGIPLVTTPTRSITEEDSRPRASVQAIYTQILEDLTKAEALLPATDAGDDASRATRIAASAILSRVYLMQGNYALARDAANRVIAAGARTLEDSFEDVFATGGESNEIIFRLAVSDQAGVNNMNTFYAPVAAQGRGDIYVTNKHLALYEANDVRADFFTEEAGLPYTNKFSDQFGDVLVVRLAEMYLTRAECNQRLGTSTGATAAADVNRIRARAGLGALGTVNLAAILKERKLELAFEGNQLDDVKRTKTSVGALPFNDNKLVLPIPQRELDTNKNLAQNPGYN
ncbi:MAG: RagB/SusD family nutrient uptake outer membrane protein [Haliscomenobacter sp.]|nr:RagB/SusD family nutrient uptake outer membrane protein [Haliscomenobacter sp.]MBK9491424.1 RagB/SusD family nutrient uptake outer membrane protein [Haliscomenobacter sp.]